MSSPAALHPVYDVPAPPLPATLEASGLPVDRVEQLIVKTLYTGELTGLALADRVRLPFTLLEPVVERVRAERLVEVRGASGSGSAAYRYALTELGRDRARQYLDGNRYIGAAPVPLASYVAYMQVLRSARGYIDRERLRQGFSHLVVGDALLEQLGPAVNANRAVFLYGPPGNGKTVIAQGMGGAIGGEMYIPYALDIDGGIVTMFDPASHESLEADDPDPLTLIAAGPRDRRWVRIRRPVIVVGGELTLEMLDLTFNRITGFYEAPIQLKANSGVFLVDDFGRQRMRPQDLLNRWIVPLESRVDYLTLHTGKKFEVPFDTLVVFATNLDPRDLADEAFLRRIPYKIRIGDPTVEEYSRIFELNCRRRRLPFHRVMVAYLQRRYYGVNRRPMRACHPRDLLDQVTALCRYRGSEPVMTRELLDKACEAYFLGEGTSHKSEVRSHKAQRERTV
ncbi:MAG: ATP-binding protein [Acidobacteria bacterium]|nr:ATP-binding protein [Acidobacteriota bacterium]